MKMYAVNSFETPIKFTNSKHFVDNDNNDVSTSKKSENKMAKVAIYSLTGLAIIGAAGILIKNLRQGRIKMPEGNTLLPTKPVNPVKTPTTFTGQTETKLTTEAQNALNNVNQQLENTTPQSFQHVIDEITMGSTEEMNGELHNLCNWYRELECNSEKAKRVKRRVSEALHKPENINPKLGETIEERLNCSSMDAATRENMRSFYTEMAEKADAQAKKMQEILERKNKELAEKQAKREAMLKLKAENPEEYARLKAERAKAKKIEKQRTKAAQVAKNTEIVDLGETKVKRIKEQTSIGTIERDYDLNSGKLVREYRSEKGKDITTIYHGDTKIAYIEDENGTTVQKMFMKNKNGQYELTSRITITPYSDILEKQVTRLSDGNTKIVEINKFRERKITIKDKKGNIVSQELYTNSGFDSEFVSAAWYEYYLALCKKYGVQPCPNGPGGAGNHYLELCLRENNPEAYERYVRIREYRATYDPMSRYMDLLGKIESGNTSNITQGDLEFLKNYVQEGNMGEKMLEQIETLEQQMAQQTMIRQPMGVYA